MTKVARNQNGVTEFCNLIEFSVSFISFKRNSREWVGNNRNTVFYDGIKDCIDFPFAEFEF